MVNQVHLACNTLKWRAGRAEALLLSVLASCMHEDFHLVKDGAILSRPSKQGCPAETMQSMTISHMMPLQPSSHSARSNKKPR